MDDYSDSGNIQTNPSIAPALVGQTDGIAEALTKRRTFWRLPILEALLVRFSPAERLALYVLAVLMVIGATMIVVELNDRVSVLVPAHGGSFTEGEVGPVRFINPVLALSQADQDLTALVYSGLTRELPDGTIVPDLASSYTISPDGTVYTFAIRSNAKFQDGSPLTAEDVLYTIQQAQDPALNSPLRANWQGVVVTAPDSHTVVFTLPHAYAPFLYDTTIGILPKSLWQNVSDEEFPFAPLNMHPVGSGPYKIQSFNTDSTGSATQYVLVPFGEYALGEPYLDTITFKFYPDDATMEKAYDDYQIDALSGINPSDLSSLTRKDSAIAQDPLPRVFGVFFNQGHSPVLADQSVRAALDAAIDKGRLVSSVLDGYGVTLDSPIPPDVVGSVAPSTPLSFTPPSASSSAQSAIAAHSYASSSQAILVKGGWTWNDANGAWEKNNQQLSLTLSTADDPQLVATANAVAADWRDAGVKVTVQVYPLSELNQNVIRPRDYDAVLFGEVVGRQGDFFAFWDSSQRNDPGLNLALYDNPAADTLLTQARGTSDEETRDKLYSQFATIVQQDQPAVFLYSPDFIYIVPRSLQGVALGALTDPSDRFADVKDWYVQLERVWTVFANKNQ